MTFSERIKKLRKEQGFSQEKLAQKINKSESTISSYELGRRTPDIETIRRLANLFNVSVDYLVGESNLKNSPHNKIKKAIEDDPELLTFWEEMSSRPDLKLLFKQTRDMSDEGIKSIINFMKSVENELDRNNN